MILQRVVNTSPWAVSLDVVTGLRSPLGPIPSTPFLALAAQDA